VYLRFVQDLSRKRTADALGMSEGQLTRRTQAALAKLRGELERSASGQRAPAPAPEPENATKQKSKEGHSGRLLLRMPQSLHAELAEAAEREEVSLNQFITNALASAVRWHQSSGGDPAQPERRTAPRWLPVAIVTNVVVMAIAAIVALILLIVAWQQGW
jgi:RNA polymerase sigma-B factor